LAARRIAGEIEGMQTHITQRGAWAAELRRYQEIDR
jgi:hypothetical protein